jgi:hypothetical protein
VIEQAKSGASSVRTQEALAGPPVSRHRPLLASRIGSVTSNTTSTGAA